MIDIALLAASTVTALVPYLAKGSEAVASEAGKSLWHWLGDKFSPQHKQKLDALKESPEDPRVQGKVEGAIEDLLTENGSLTQELSALMTAAKESTISVINSKNTVVGNIHSGGSITIGDNNTGGK
jgi:hypothetical protein